MPKMPDRFDLHVYEGINVYIMKNVQIKEAGIHIFLRKFLWIKELVVDGISINY
jgi:hypothetical protein